jgi:HEAT repeat protein
MSSKAAWERDLAAPFPSIRLFALEEIIRSGDSTEILELLATFQSKEGDEECRLLFDYALTAVKSRLQPVAAERFKTAEAFLEAFQIAPSAQKFHFLNTLDRKLQKEAATAMIPLLQTESHIAVFSKIVKTFAPFWPPEVLGTLKPYLRSSSTNVRMAVLEVFVQKAPGILKRDLPRLLKQKDTIIRSLAIRGLSQIDLPASLEHFEHLLLEGDAQDKRLLLQQAIYFPFAAIRPILLKSLAAETDMGLLESCSLLLENNPDLETPPRIMSLAEKSVPPKSAFFHALFDRCCRQILKTGLLQAEEKEYLQELYLLHERYKLEEEVLADVQRLAGKTGPKDPIFRKVQECLRDPEYHRIFAKNLELPWSEGIRTKLAAVLQAVPPPGSDQTAERAALTTDRPPSPSVEESDTATFSLAGKDEKLSNADIPAPPPTSELTRRIASLTAQELIAESSHFKSLLQGKETTDEVIAITFKALCHSRIEGFVSEAKAALNSSHPQTLVYALTYTSFFDLAFFLSQISRFLHHESLLVKRSTVKALKEVEPKAALALIREMVFSGDVKCQKDAVACMVSFDFSLIRDLAAEIPTLTNDQDVFSMVMILFQSNPQPENLFTLYSLEKKVLTPSWAESLRLVREQNRADLLRLGLGKQRAGSLREEELAERYLREKAQKAGPSEKYSFQEVFHPSFRSSLWNSVTEAFDDIRLRSSALAAFIAKSFWGKLGTGLFLLFVLAILFFSFSDGEKAPSQTDVPLVSPRLKISGTVTKPGKMGITVETSAGETYFLKPATGQFAQEFSPGENVEADVVPFRGNSPKNLTALCLEIRKN